MKNQHAKLYFDFRLKQEELINAIKKRHAEVKKTLIGIIKKHKNVSIRRITDAIVISKKLQLSGTESIFNMIIAGLEGKRLENYENAKDEIKTYIEEVAEMSAELKEARRAKRKEFNKFKKEIDIDLTMLNHYYLQLKADIITYHKLKLNEKSFDKLVQETAFLKDVKEEYFRKEIKKIDKQRVKDIQEKRHKKEQEELQANYVLAMFGVDGNEEDDEEKAVFEILMNSGLDF
jgi:hypothetical protein